MTAIHPPLIEALLDPARYDHPVERVELEETHISWVLLAGAYAYKIKKPLDLGFLDFSTLERRRYYCAEELRLNRRLAPGLYLAVVPIAGAPHMPVLDGTGAPIEYAVKMRRFPRETRLDQVLARGGLEPGHIDLLARELAEFHARVAVAGPESPFGAPEAVYAPMRENFEQIRRRGGDAEDLGRLAQLEAWTARRYVELADPLRARKRAGFIRECHGDAHLANMVLLGGDVVLFDCIEFSENLRWIDVLSELAFTVMDLDDRGRPELARRLLNAYLEHTGDYEGLSVFRFCQVYRALVRAKVACIRLAQPDLGPGERAAVRRDYRNYAALAESYTRPAPALLLITHGVSGTGKSTLTQALIEALDAVRVRSDVERKRLHGVERAAAGGSALDAGLYTPQASRRTYERLAQLARALLRAGHSAVVDATFIKREQRELLRAVATEARAPFVLLDIRASTAVLRERVGARARFGRDVSEANLAVLEHQLATAEPLAAAELSQALAVDGERPPAPSALVAELQRRTGGATG